MKKINLFFLQPGGYSCIITTKETIKTAFDRKITVNLEPARFWEKGTFKGFANDAPVLDIQQFDDTQYYYVDANKWLTTPADRPMYMALPKKFANGKEYNSKNLEEGLGDMPCGVFLFPKAIVIKIKKRTHDYHASVKGEVA